MVASGIDSGRLFARPMEKRCNGTDVRRVVGRYPTPSFPFIIASNSAPLMAKFSSSPQAAHRFGAWQFFLVSIGKPLAASISLAVNARKKTNDLLSNTPTFAPFKWTKCTHLNTPSSSPCRYRLRCVKKRD